MKLLATKATLSPARQQLVRLVQQVNFGKLVGLHVRRGEPVFDPSPKVMRDISFRAGAENGPHRDFFVHDGVLQPAFVELFRQLAGLGDGLIEQITITDGRPVRMTYDMHVSDDAPRLL